MKEILLTQGKVALVDDEDFEWLNQWKWYADKIKNIFYAARNRKTVNGKHRTIRMHRAIMGLPNTFFVDHRDGNGLNNQRNNMRICTNQQNTSNQKPHSNCSSIYKGVSWNKEAKKWYANIMINYKSISLGYFDSEIEAAKIYDEAAKLYFGEFARTNF